MKSKKKTAGDVNSSMMLKYTIELSRGACGLIQLKTCIQMMTNPTMKDTEGH